MNERRGFPRYPFVAYTEVMDLELPGAYIRARTSDLAREGCYVDTITPFEVGTDVLVKMMKNGQTLSVNGRVFYSYARLGMGIRFTSIQPAEIAVVEAWIKELRGAESVPDDTQDSGRLETILNQLSNKKL